MTDGYNETYGAGEVSEIVIDIITAVLVAVFGLATLVGLILIFGWMKKKIPKF